LDFLLITVEHIYHFALDVTALEHNVLEPIPLEPVLLELKPVVWNLTLFSENNPAPPGTVLGLAILNTSRQP
jgi:hypothetical protein